MVFTQIIMWTLGILQVWYFWKFQCQLQAENADKKWRVVKWKHLIWNSWLGLESFRDTTLFKCPLPPLPGFEIWSYTTSSVKECFTLSIFGYHQYATGQEDSWLDTVFGEQLVARGSK